VAVLERECFGAEAYSEYLLSALVQSSSAISLVAEDEGKVVGFAAAAATPPRAVIYTVNVKPGKRRMGVATALLAALERELKAIGVSEVVLQVEVGNAPAMLLYEKAGYKLDGAVPNYYGPGRDALIMSKALRA
jgi:ribosomal protein S18 acetylase RimI-like enzyme